MGGTLGRPVRLRSTLASTFYRAQVGALQPQARPAWRRGRSKGVAAPTDTHLLATNRGEAERERVHVTAMKEPGRKDPCPCGSGKIQEMPRAGGGVR
ncbi:MAG: SEC-C domain-containing protein [Gemmatimonadetes bacterium]|nr:SEC-C domain-containing protein [Gemmatimonadota bacterium]